MWTCKKCGANNSGNAQFCPNCGQPREPQKKPVKSGFPVQTVILCACVLLVLTAILLFFFKQQETPAPVVTTQIVYVTVEPAVAPVQTPKPAGISTTAPTTPTPVPTEEPRPSSEDLKPFGTTITYPSANAYLDHYETMYVKSGKGHSIYVFWKANGAEEYRRSFYLYEKDEVTVLARQNGFSCVVFTDANGVSRAGWVNSAYLVYVY